MSNSLEVLRNRIFWIVDSIKKNSVKNHYNDIKFINENFTSKESKRRRREALQKLLNHTIKTVPYYKEIEGKELTKFSVVNKNVIRNNFKKFQSDLFLDEPKTEVQTSGSTGTPFTTYQDKNKKIRNTADTIYFAERSGFKLGYELLFIRLWGEQHKKSFVMSWIQNMVAHNVINLSDQDIDKLLKKIKSSSSNKGIVAYASALDAIGHYLDKHNFDLKDCNIKSVIGVAEGLSEYAKKTTKKYFGVSAISRYSNIENGIIAQQNTADGNFYINWASYVVEILKFDSDTLVKEGETGRIVITDLYNYAVPMIRYDTGDIGAIITEKENGCIVLSKVEGRKMDALYTTKGELIASHIVHLICLNKDIKQYQLVQEGKKKYLFKINTTSVSIDKQKIVKTYKEFLGDDAEIEIEYVDDIPLLSSGKRKKVINLYYN